MNSPLGALAFYVFFFSFFALKFLEHSAIITGIIMNPNYHRPGFQFSGDTLPHPPTPPPRPTFSLLSKQREAFLFAL